MIVNDNITRALIVRLSRTIGTETIPGFSDRW